MYKMKIVLPALKYCDCSSRWWLVQMVNGLMCWMLYHLHTHKVMEKQHNFFCVLSKWWDVQHQKHYLHDDDAMNTQDHCIYSSRGYCMRSNLILLPGFGTQSAYKCKKTEELCPHHQMAHMKHIVFKIHRMMVVVRHWQQQWSLFFYEVYQWMIVWKVHTNTPDSTRNLVTFRRRGPCAASGKGISEAWKRWNKNVAASYCKMPVRDKEVNHVKQRPLQITKK